MGKIIKFDPKRRKPKSKWTDPAAYGVPPQPSADKAKTKPRGPRDWKVALAWLGIAALCSVWVLLEGGVLG